MSLNCLFVKTFLQPQQKLKAILLDAGWKDEELLYHLDLSLL